MSLESIRSVLHLFDRTIWIVTSQFEERRGGLVATFVNNVSVVSDLPRVLVGIAPHHFTWSLIERSGCCALHLITESQIDWIWRFGLVSGRYGDKLNGLTVSLRATGAPILADALAWIDCHIESRFDVGDRVLCVATVVDGEVNHCGLPLTAQRLWDLSDEERREQMNNEKVRDAEIDRKAILQWRAAHKNNVAK